MWSVLSVIIQHNLMDLLIPAVYGNMLSRDSNKGAFKYYVSINMFPQPE